jgi:hypothetical protein
MQAAEPPKRVSEWSSQTFKTEVTPQNDDEVPNIWCLLFGARYLVP